MSKSGGATDFNDYPVFLFKSAQLYVKLFFRGKKLYESQKYSLLYS